MTQPDDYSRMVQEARLDSELNARKGIDKSKVNKTNQIKNDQKRKSAKRNLLREDDKNQNRRQNNALRAWILTLFVIVIVMGIVVYFAVRLNNETQAAIAESNMMQQTFDARNTQLEATNEAIAAVIANIRATNTAMSSTSNAVIPQSIDTPYPTEIPATKTPVVAVFPNDPEVLIDNPYMQNYQADLEYQVADNLLVPADILKGFVPVKSLVMTNLVLPDGYRVEVTNPPVNVDAYACFPQDYSVSDAFNRGCQKLQNEGNLPWVTPIAGYNDGENWSCDSPDGWCADDIQSFNWRVITGYEICHPAVGCIKDPDGGAAMILFVNFHDSDEVWGPRNDSAIYVDSGFIGYGMMWDLSGGTYNIGDGIADLRNHYFYNLSSPVGGDNRYSGQCGTSGLCETITYVVVARVWDRPELGINFSHFELIDYGQWSRP